MGYTQESPDYKLTSFSRLSNANIYRTLNQNCITFILQSLYMIMCHNWHKNNTKKQNSLYSINMQSTS